MPGRGVRHHTRDIEDDGPAVATRTARLASVHATHAPGVAGAATGRVSRPAVPSTSADVHPADPLQRADRTSLPVRHATTASVAEETATVGATGADVTGSGGESGAGTPHMPVRSPRTAVTRMR